MPLPGHCGGGREAYHADPHVFEKRWNVGERSFFGANAWERQYYGNRYYEGAKHRPEFGNAFRDYWHFAGLSSRVIYVGGTFAIGNGKRPLKHKALDLLIGSAVASASGLAVYSYLR